MYTGTWTEKGIIVPDDPALLHEKHIKGRVRAFHDGSAVQAGPTWNPAGTPYEWPLEKLDGCHCNRVSTRENPDFLLDPQTKTFRSGLLNIRVSFDVVNTEWGFDAINVKKI